MGRNRLSHRRCSQIRIWRFDMTIYFCGQDFKYEIEGVCKLFFPLVRFTHVYNAPETAKDSADYVHTLRRREEAETLLRVAVQLDGEKTVRETSIPNEQERYDNECERMLCVLLYRILEARIGVSPRWGILTGVRPVNIIQRERLTGKSDAEIAAWLSEKYLVSAEKLKLAFLTADTQEPMLRSMKPRSFSLYIAIPFCVSRCSYCSFVSHAITTKKATDKVDDYVLLLCRELEKAAEVAKDEGLTLDTIYIGGGTPTALSAQQLKTVADTVGRCFDVSAAREYTIEAGRADTITEEKLRVIKEAGATRISINPQTFEDAVLQNIGRKHTAKQAEESFLLARRMGFSLVNMDFIAGLPGDTCEGFCRSIDKALSLDPENITVHTLSIKRSADLFQESAMREYVRSDITGRMTEYAQKALIEAGYRPYYLYRQKNTVGNLENVGYAKPRTESLYNIYIMDEIQSIIACGAGGVTKLVGLGKNPIERIFNYKYHFEYIDRFDEILNRKDRLHELCAEGRKQPRECELAQRNDVVSSDGACKERGTGV